MKHPNVAIWQTPSYGLCRRKYKRWRKARKRMALASRKINRKGR